MMDVRHALKILIKVQTRLGLRDGPALSGNTENYWNQVS